MTPGNIVPGVPGGISPGCGYVAPEFLVVGFNIPVGNHPFFFGSHAISELSGRRHTCRPSMSLTPGNIVPGVPGGITISGAMVLPDIRLLSPPGVGFVLITGGCTRSGSLFCVFFF